MPPLSANDSSKEARVPPAAGIQVKPCLYPAGLRALAECVYHGRLQRGNRTAEQADENIGQDIHEAAVSDVELQTA